MSTDKQIEQEIQAKGLTAPRVTPADVEANISAEFYFTADDGIEGSRARGQLCAIRRDDRMASTATSLLTFCVLVLKNGFTVTGESACASPENFDAEVGRKIARANAVNKIWPLMGYELRSKLADGWNPEPKRVPYSVADIIGYETSAYGQDWTARFSDGTQVRIAVGMCLDKLRDNGLILRKCVDAHNEATGGKQA